MRKQYKNSAAPCATPTNALYALPLCGSRRDSRGLLGSLSGLRERMRGAPYATTPRAIRPIPENRNAFRTTVSVASLARDFGHFIAKRDSAARRAVAPRHKAQRHKTTRLRVPLLSQLGCISKVDPAETRTVVYRTLCKK